MSIVNLGFGTPRLLALGFYGSDQATTVVIPTARRWTVRPGNGRRPIKIQQDRDEILDHSLVWDRVLNGDEIASVSYVANNLTLMTDPAPSNSATISTFWVKDVIGKTGTVEATVITEGGRKLQQTVYFTERVS